MKYKVDFINITCLADISTHKHTFYPFFWGKEVRKRCTNEKWYDMIINEFVQETYHSSIYIKLIVFLNISTTVAWLECPNEPFIIGNGTDCGLKKGEKDAVVPKIFSTICVGESFWDNGSDETKRARIRRKSLKK